MAQRTYTREYCIVRVASPHRIEIETKTTQCNAMQCNAIAMAMAIQVRRLLASFQTTITYQTIANNKRRAVSVRLTMVYIVYERYGVVIGHRERGARQYTLHTIKVSMHARECTNVYATAATNVRCILCDWAMSYALGYWSGERVMMR